MNWRSTKLKKFGRDAVLAGAYAEVSCVGVPSTHMRSVTARPALGSARIDDSNFSSAELKFDLGAISTAERGILMIAVPPFGVPSGHGAMGMMSSQSLAAATNYHRGDARRFYVMLLSCMKTAAMGFCWCDLTILMKVLTAFARPDMPLTFSRTSWNVAPAKRRHVVRR
eukprot:1940632-Prymnesium_polylepis.1